MVITYRIKTSNLAVYETENKIYKKSKTKFPEAISVAELFKANDNLKAIISKSNSKFLKGGFQDGRTIGEKINILPDGRILDKPYSLFAPKLTIHDESSTLHWDAIFQNPNGKMAYLYDTEKKKLLRNKKYQKVENFTKCLPRLKTNLTKALDVDPIALPMLILLKTKIRIGNETYYLKNHHKGLTTLKKKDVKINRGGIEFNFIGKDGVPHKIKEAFPKKIIDKLSQVLKTKRKEDFIFAEKNNKPLKDTIFEKAFQKYCGQKFYPHIVRSHYATEETKKFLKKHRETSREEVKKFYLKLAEKLGHKKLTKDGKWENSYEVTLHYYIQPELVEEIKKLTYA